MHHRIRDKAVDALWRAERENRFVEDVLAGVYPRGLKENERALLTELAYGVTRWRGTLDHVLDRYRPLRKMRPRLRWIFRVALFQMGFLGRVPDRVAVDAAVDQAKRSFGIGGAKLTNAVLRRIQSEWTVEPASGRDPDPRCSVSCAPGEIWRGPENAFPDPAAQPIQNLAARFSVPGWLLERWTEAYGEQAVRTLAAAQNRRPALHCWIDSPGGDAASVRSALAEEGVVAEPTPFGLRVIEGAARVVGSRPFAAGKLLIQDETAASVVPFLGVQPGDRVLEVGAAPGSKTVQLARAAGDEGWVVAVDRSLRRLKRVRENVERFGLERRVELVAGDGTRLPDTFGEAFDRVLIDAPCSNTGVLARRHEARWRLRPDDVAALARIQAEMLAAGLFALRRGEGRLVYSTCSIEREENQDVVRGGAASTDLEAEALVLPDEGRDGGYKARIRKH